MLKDFWLLAVGYWLLAVGDWRDGVGLSAGSDREGNRDCDNTLCSAHVQVVFARSRIRFRMKMMGESITFIRRVPRQKAWFD